mmetsp:Transcript_15584/g.35762  ORF Transcript_15584/g.35762 Transcript_15584/m.35762 type:complete len:355 (-) Transcript_15584:85-1149(-)
MMKSAIARHSLKPLLLRGFPACRLQAPVCQVLLPRQLHGAAHQESTQPQSPNAQQVEGYNGRAEDSGRLWNGIPNHIWSEEEVQERLGSLWQHRPVTRWDKVMHKIMWGLYRGFNWMTGFKPVNTPVRAVEWRLIVLESVAGVPGFLAAMMRHFRSLRTLQRDHGWIHTLLEEAENERMHLLVCMSRFEAGLVTRCLCQAAQVTMTPFLGVLYLIKPEAVHRFVGYLEETACLTYANIIQQVETPGTPLHDAWGKLPAPKLAVVYWRLKEDAMWLDCLKCMFADECNHRDVNHTFASMNANDPNPFVEKHKKDAIIAWRMEKEDQHTDLWLGCAQTLTTKTKAPTKGGEVHATT